MQPMLAPHADRCARRASAEQDGDVQHLWCDESHAGAEWPATEAPGDGEDHPNRETLVMSKTATDKPIRHFFLSYRCDGCRRINTRAVYDGTEVKPRLSLACYNCGPRMHTNLGRTTPRQGGKR